MIDCTKYEETLAKELAEEVNGSSWNTHYTDAQKSGWVLKVKYIIKNWFNEEEECD